MTDAIFVWLFFAAIVFAFMAMGAGLNYSDGDYGDARICAWFALTAWLWPVYLATLIIYAAVGLIAIAMDVEHPLRPVWRFLKRRFTP